MQKRTHRLLATATALLVAAGAAAAADPAGQIWGHERGLLTRDEAGYRFVTGTTRVEVLMPAGARIDKVIPLRETTFVSAVAASRAGEGGTELVLGLASATGWIALPAPAGRAAGISRANAVPVADRQGELASIAWLEGSRRESNAVQVAAWNGTGWSEPVQIAGPGPGSQLALASATLDDGSAILVWSRFDGADDEVVFSRLVDGQWQPAQSIAPDNQVPDIVPAVVATQDGALVAWNRYDGHDYRVVVARFANGTWSAPEPVGGPGSVFPTFERIDGGARLLFESARPHGWNVLELEGSGKIRREARLETPDRQRPVVMGQSARWAEREIFLRWN